MQVARLAECHNNRRRVTTNTPAPEPTEEITEPTEAPLEEPYQYWISELKNKAEATKQKYEFYFAEFLAYTKKTPNELIVQRQQDLLNKDIKIQRRIETQFLAFIKAKEKEGYSVASQQIFFAATRSFFEINYFPLRLRRGDYPHGDSDGVRRATKEIILKILYHEKSKNLVTLKPLVLFIKDTGLRVSDVRNLNCGFFIDTLAKNPNTDLIQLNIITQKTKLLAKTFIGEEAIEALKEYLEIRRKGTQKIAPETITANSPLFKTWRSYRKKYNKNENGKVQRINRSSISSLIASAFNFFGEKRMSAHSLRKKLQTDLEKGGMPTNWIDQVLGHKLINSRDAYSLPTDDELAEAYRKAYPLIRVYPEINPQPEQPTPTPQITGQITNTGTQATPDVLEIKANDIQAIKQALLKGYKHADTVGDIRLYLKT